MIDKRVIVHVVIGESSISRIIVESILKYSNFGSFFIVTKGADPIKFRDLFERYGTSNFILCDELKSSVLSMLVTRMSVAVLGRLSPLFTSLPYDELRIIFRFRKNPVLLHGISFSYLAHLLLLNRLKSLSYVCWGYVPKPKGKSAKSKLLFFVHRHIFRGYKRIACLMTEDKTDFELAFGVLHATTLTYQSDILNYDDPQEIIREKSLGPQKVLLGNSACYTESYLKLLPAVLRVGASAKVTCMLSYPEGDALGKKQDVIRAFASVFGETFTPWLQQLDLKSYAEKMKKHDIYICGVDRQTGLGAIYVMLMYGKKIYLTGKNLAWIRENKFIVYDVSQLETETEEAFLRRLSPEERKLNRERLLDMLSPSALAKEWDLFYAQL